MRAPVTPEKLEQFMTELAARARGSGNVYFTGGATALLLGLREQTIDVDLRLDPEPAGVFQAIAELKNKLEINVELASPLDFIPVAPDWKSRSLFIARKGQLSFYHFDLSGQVLSKIERGHAKDLADAKGFLIRGGLSLPELLKYFEIARPDLLRYPAVHAADFETKIKAFAHEFQRNRD